MINNVINYISMGGNGFYIWVGYIVPLILIFSFVFFQKIKLNRLLKKIREND